MGVENKKAKLMPLLQELCPLKQYKVVLPTHTS
jgi:hypothetical protein